MTIKTWRVEARIKGPLVLSLDCEKGPHPAITRTSITPENGFLCLRFWINGDDNEGIGIIGMASDCLERITALLSVIPWEALDAQLLAVTEEEGGKVITSLSPLAGEIRRKPVHLKWDRQVPLALSDNRLARAVLWTRRGLEDVDPYDRFIDFMIATDFVAPRFPGARPRQRPRACPKCGLVEMLDPGLHEYFMNLCHLALLDQEEATRIWQLRGNLFHGGVDVAIASRLEVINHTRPLEIVVRYALDQLVLHGLSKIPLGPRFGDIVFGSRKS